jgi:hypothetical protein
MGVELPEGRELDGKVAIIEQDVDTLVSNSRGPVASGRAGRRGSDELSEG